MLEIAVDGPDSAVNAIDGGASELVLCSLLSDGGLTPSFGLVKVVKRMVKSLSKNMRPKVNVMIRCRGGNDYVYAEPEMRTMLHDIQIFKDMNVDGFVFGALTENREVDEYNCMKVLAVANPKTVTFSRAFDYVREFRKVAALLINLGFHRVHTAGVRKDVNQPGAIKNLSYLCSRYSHSELRIVPCGGVSPDNVGCFINMGCTIVHALCEKPMELPTSKRFFSLTETEYVPMITDLVQVRELKDSIEQAVEERDRDDDEDDEGMPMSN